MTVTTVRKHERIHMIGIAGVGMVGIAEILLREGYTVSGSDLKETALTQKLRDLGAEITIGHNENTIKGAQLVVRSTAVKDTNPEFAAASQQSIPIILRAEMLAWLMRSRYGIAIAGTHGKTTTTSLTACVLEHGALDPTYVIGGKLNSIDSNAKLGQSDYFLVEADESDASFLHFQPRIAVVTNIDRDHMETYDNDEDKLKQTFIDFLQKLPSDGVAIVCADDQRTMEVATHIKAKVISYGFSETADVQIRSYLQDGMQTKFDVFFHATKSSFPVNLNMPGRYNACNAVAAVAVANVLEVKVAAIQKALLEFTGVGRRMQYHGAVPMSGGEVLVYDDYGHHPREVAVTLEAVKAAWPSRRVLWVFQPHRFSRVRDCFDEFVEVLAAIESLFLLPVYAAGEKPLPGFDSPSLASEIESRGGLCPNVLSEDTELSVELLKTVQPGDVVIFQGAGSVGSMAVNMTANKFKSIVE